MTATDQLRAALRDLEAKARQAEIDKKIETFADQADRFLRTAAARAGELAAENRDRIDAKLAQAGASVDSHTDGKYHSYVDKVRSGVLTGVDWVAEQREPAERPDAGSAASPQPAAPAAPTASADDLGDEGITAEGAWAATTDTATATDPMTEDPQTPQAPTDR
jgi:ElaB/YqjD/DUF883 family membrane-anchored ribosome-binding protein